MKPVGPVDVGWFAALLVCGVAWSVAARRRRTGATPYSVSSPDGGTTPDGASSPDGGTTDGASRRDAPRRPRGLGLPVLADVLDPRANGLNTVRLVLAAAVLVWHSYPLTGRDLRAGPVTSPLAHLLADGPVDGFFAVSGFLIAGSWARRPDLVSFLRSRTLRIMPAYLVCLVVTACVIAPVGLLLGREEVGLLDYVRSAASYVGSSAGLALFQYDIAGTPSSVPYPGAWNGSIWTLQWEVGCYLGVLLLGVLGLLRHRGTSVVVFLAASAGSALVTLGALGPEPGAALTELPRLTAMFAAGMLLFALRDRVPVHPVLVGVAGLGVLACLWLPDYRVPGALLLAYVLLAVGAGLRRPRWHLHDDISYGVYIYAFPVQQVLALTPVVRAPLAVFVLASAIVTLPLAVASWVLVERPLLRRRHGPGRGTLAVTGGPAPPAEAARQPTEAGSDPNPQASTRQSR